jgi:hypothetical protein
VRKIGGVMDGRFLRRLVAPLLLVPGVAHASPDLMPVTNRDYQIDLYDGVPIGNSMTIAMGGASAALASGSSGTLVNASASAVRSTTDRDSWGVDVHLDYLNGSLSNDFTNSGLPASPQTTGATEITAGLALRVHDWAGAVTLTEQSIPLVTVMPPAGDSYTVEAQTWHARLAAAKWVPQLDLALGVAAEVILFNITPTCSGSGCGSLFSIDGAGFVAGATYIPRSQSFRIGGEASTPIGGGSVVTSNCNPNNCDLSTTGEGFILPDDVYKPWRATLGVAYRWAATAWNQTVATDFRDERSVTVAVDVVATGESPNAYGLIAFGEHELERSGAHVSWSPRGGVEYEWLPGRLRLRAGSYWEPGRFEGVDGRVHATFGIELRALEFHAWGLRRGAITLTGDAASDFQNVGISIGFWH